MNHKQLFKKGNTVIHKLFMQYRVIRSQKIILTKWDIIRCLLIALLMFSPAILTYFHYFDRHSLLSFAIFSLLGFTVLLLCSAQAKWTIPLVLISIVSGGYHISIGKPLGFQTMAAMYETNLTEIAGFLSSPYSIPLFIGGGAVSFCLLWCLFFCKPLPKLAKKTYIRKRYAISSIVITLSLIFISAKYFSSTYPLNLAQSNIKYLEEKKNCIDYLQMDYIHKTETSAPNDDNITILVIGEAARRANFSAYGYQRLTTPYLDKFKQENPSNIIQFSNMISSAAFTRATVLPLLSPINAKDISKVHTKPSISKIFRGANYNTLYATARPKYINPNILSIFLNDSETKAYTGNIRQREYDESLIPIVRNFITGKKGKTFLIVHLKGSHIRYADQYPKTFKYFDSDDEWRDTYDDSIRYSDFVIQKLVDIMMASSKAASLYYISDHGENLNDYKDNNYGHGTKAFTKYEFEIPFIFYCNDSFRKQHHSKVIALRKQQHAPLSQDHIAHTILGFAGMNNPDYYQPSQDISSCAFSPGNRYVLDENMAAFNYHDLQLQKRKPDTTWAIMKYFAKLHQ